MKFTWYFFCAYCFLAFQCSGVSDHEAVSQVKVRQDENDPDRQEKKSFLIILFFME